MNALRYRFGMNLSALSFRDFRIYLGGNLFASNALWMQRVTIGWLAWDLTSPGVDGVNGTDDDYIVPSLASSWTTELPSVANSQTYVITFNLRPGTRSSGPLLILRAARCPAHLTLLRATSGQRSAQPSRHAALRPALSWQHGSLANLNPPAGSSRSSCFALPAPRPQVCSRFGARQ